MGVFEQFPYTDHHDLNLDWVLRTVKDTANRVGVVEEKVAPIDTTIAAANAAAAAATTAADNATDTINDILIPAVNNANGALVNVVAATNAAIEAANNANSAANSYSIWKNVVDFGAKGDWNTATRIGTDNLPFFTAALDALPPEGGVIYIPKGDYMVSDGWCIDKSNVIVIVAPDAIVRAPEQTTYWGGVIVFGNQDIATSLTPTITNCKIFGGGKVIAESGWDDAIGAGFIDGFECYGLTLIAPWKSITLQFVCWNAHVHHCKLVQTGTDSAANLHALTIESYCKNCNIHDNIMVSGNGGVNVTTAVTWDDVNGNTHNVPPCENIIISRNQISPEHERAIHAEQVINLVVSDNDINGGDNGIILNNVTNAHIRDNFIRSVSIHAIQTIACDGVLRIEGNTIKDVCTGQVAIHFKSLLDQNATEVYCLHNIITSALHTYAFYGELCDQAVFKAFIGNYTKKGTAEAAATGYNGITPGYIDDIFGGLRLNTAAPVSDWTPTIGGTTNPEIAYTTQYGKRVKLGKLNILIFTCTIATITGGTGNAYITGFPQVAGDTVLHNFHCQIWNYTTITPKAPNLFHNGNNMASMQICYGNPITERLAVANLANGFGISGTMFYFDN